MHIEVLLQTNVLSKINVILDDSDPDHIYLISKIIYNMAYHDVKVVSHLQGNGCIVKLSTKLAAICNYPTIMLQVLSCLISCCDLKNVPHDLCRGGILTNLRNYLTDEDPHIQGAVITLFTLCINDNEHAGDFIRRADPIPTLVVLLSNEDITLQWKVATCLWGIQLIEPIEASISLRNAKGIELLLGVVRKLSDSEKPFSSDSLELSQVGELDTNLLGLINIDPTLISLVRLTVIALKLIDRCFTEDRISRDMCHQQSGVVLLLKVIKDDYTISFANDVVRWACHSIGSSCLQHDQNRLVVHTEDGIATLLHLQTHRSQNIVSAMVYALGRVLDDSELNKKQFGENGGIATLLKLTTQNQQNYGTLVWIVSALHHAVTENDQNTASVRLLNGFPRLVGLLHCKEAEVQWRTARLLCYFAQNSDVNRMCLMTDGATSVLSALTGHSSPYVRHYAEKALAAFEPGCPDSPSD